MSKLSPEYRAGWAAARACYQSTGGVPPHPPEPAPEEEPTPETPIGGADVAQAPTKSSKRGAK